MRADDTPRQRAPIPHRFDGNGTGGDPTWSESWLMRLAAVGSNPSVPAIVESRTSLRVVSVPVPVTDASGASADSSWSAFCLPERSVVDHRDVGVRIRDLRVAVRGHGVHGGVEQDLDRRDGDGVGRLAIDRLLDRLRELHQRRGHGSLRDREAEWTRGDIPVEINVTRGYGTRGQPLEARPQRSWQASAPRSTKTEISPRVRRRILRLYALVHNTKSRSSSRPEQRTVLGKRLRNGTLALKSLLNWRPAASSL